MASGEVPRSLFYSDKISLRPAGTATLVCNLDSKCKILRKHDIDGKSSNKPGECSSKLDILGLCETFLDENIDGNILQMEGFNFERKDRAALRQGALNTKRGGGVAVYIADHIKYKRRNDFESSEIESIWLEVNLKKHKTFSYKLCIKAAQLS